MSYVSLGSLGALPPGLPPLPKDYKRGYVDEMVKKLSPAVRAQLLAEGLKALAPVKCWGRRTENCVNARFDDPVIWPIDQCRAIAYGWVGEWDRMTAAANNVKYCDELAPRNAAIYAGIGGLAVGVVLGWVLKRR